MTTDKIIAAAREAGFDASNGFSLLIVRHSNGSWIDVSEELTTFYALAFKAGMERAAEICKKELNYPNEQAGIDMALWNAIDAILSEAHAKNQPESTHDTGNEENEGN